MSRRAPVIFGGLLVLVGACSPSGRDPVSQVSPPAPGPAVAATAAVATVSPASATTSARPAPGATAAASTIGSAPAAPAPPRPPAPPATAILRGAVAVEPAARLPLTPGAEMVVHPAATFELELTARAPDARLVLVDARDDLVPARATREVGVATRLTLAPAAPLVPGWRYVLRLEGASDRELHDDVGRAFSAVTLPLLVAGSPPPPEPKKPAKKKRRR